MHKTVLSLQQKIDSIEAVNSTTTKLKNDNKNEPKLELNKRSKSPEEESTIVLSQNGTIQSLQNDVVPDINEIILQLREGIDTMPDFNKKALCSEKENSTKLACTKEISSPNRENNVSNDDQVSQRKESNHTVRMLNMESPLLQMENDSISCLSDEIVSLQNNNEFIEVFKKEMLVIQEENEMMPRLHRKTATRERENNFVLFMNEKVYPLQRETSSKLRQMSRCHQKRKRMKIRRCQMRK